jgi:hypothetical protein
MRKKPAQISKVLPTLLKSIESGFQDSAHRIWEVWDDAVGPELAKRTKPLSFKKGQLTIAVDGASWLGQMGFITPKIIEELNKRVTTPKVTSIKCRAASVPPPRKKPIVKPLLYLGELSKEEEELIKDAASGVEDIELKEAIMKAREKELRRRRPPLDPKE